VAGSSLCVYCRKHQIEPQFAPFCSERCRLFDLAAWVDGRYAVPGDLVSPELEPPDAPDEG
jgi:endogenous inhibitor of DNA gyrase (YacG/DUF329 family)